MSLNSFAERLRRALGDRKPTPFAKDHGLSVSGFSQYLKGTSEPTRPMLIDIANYLDVNLLWLATGEGPMRPGEGAVEVPPDYDILRDALETVDTVLERADRVMDPNKKAELIVMVYKFLAENDHVEKDKVIELLRKIA